MHRRMRVGVDDCRNRDDQQNRDERQPIEQAANEPAEERGVEEMPPMPEGVIQSREDGPG